jgi:hypothetical protein
MELIDYRKRRNISFSRSVSEDEFKLLLNYLKSSIEDLKEIDATENWRGSITMKAGEKIPYFCFYQRNLITNKIKLQGFQLLWGENGREYNESEMRIVSEIASRIENLVHEYFVIH